MSFLRKAMSQCCHNYGGEEVQNKDNCEQVANILSQLLKSTKYAGLVYYEEKGVEDLVRFTAAKKLEALIQFIERKHSQAEIGPDISFSFKIPYDYIELNFTAQQDEPFNGWTVKPHTKPSRLYQEAVDKFGDKECHPSSCLLSIYGSPDAVPFLNYSVPLVGVVHPVTLIIHRARRNLAVPVYPTNPATSSSNTITEVTAVSSNGRASVSATVDVDKVKKAINGVLVSHYATLNSLPKKSFIGLVNQLYSADLISNEVKEDPSMKECIDEFMASLSFKRSLPKVQEHCQKFLKSFIAVRGSCVDAAKALGEDWIKAINELGFDFCIDIDA
ncbi:PREDICTED: uncharacterized protein LOC109587762 [Amphimedon queenslandica]|uniref:Uncharacterized protein n=1 Tax=Amphimedon queenslandica TaxID=400682 RepID=A0AAN0JR51_AMPQE|nr:PREDICTED: uncharacterized protein LOC109587762 [Amphimedon queenslandica]|eukprot:XP_019859545.1 PREDICTED: uncharacterized protein LOC109587762 [Amphimedon queenslandica]